MYSGQFDQFTTFSVSLRSLAAAALGAAEPDAAVPVPVPLLPQALSATVALRPSAPVTQCSSAGEATQQRGSHHRVHRVLGGHRGSPCGWGSGGLWGQRAGSGVSGVFRVGRVGQDSMFAMTCLIRV